MKKLITIILIVVVGFFVLSFLKDQLIRVSINVVGSQIVGAPVRVGGFSLGVLNQKIRIKNLKMYNPRGFPKGVIINLPKANVDFDLFSLLKGKLHLINMDIELKEFLLVKNKDGKLNVDALGVSQTKEENEPAKKVQKDIPLQIDNLHLKMTRFVKKDYSSGLQPSVEVHDLNFNKSYKNIRSAQQLVVLILSEPMKAAGIKSAAIYGVSVFTGVAVLPVSVAATFIGKDSAQANLQMSFDKVYNTSLEVLKKIGKVTQEDKSGLSIKAQVNGANVAVKFKKISIDSTQLVVSARKFMLPKPEVASGIIYQISEKLKKSES